MGSKGHNSFFSESSHVAYQIKGNEINDILYANILPLHTRSILGWGLKVRRFLSNSMHIAYQMNRKVGHAHSMVIYSMDGVSGLLFCIAIRHALVYFNIGQPLVCLNGEEAFCRASFWPVEVF